MSDQDDDFERLTSGYHYRLGRCYISGELCESPEHHIRMGPTPVFVEWSPDGFYPFPPPGKSE